MLAVADADISADQVRHFDAVAVGEAQRTFEPPCIWLGHFGAVCGGRCSHLLNLLNVG
jgi:hypothetical protein